MKKLKIFLYTFLASLFFAYGYIKYRQMNSNDIALKILTWVKKIKGDNVDLTTLNHSETSKIEHYKWTALLQKYVSPSGLVNYNGFIQDKATLQHYLDDLSKHYPGDNWTEKEKIAFWINAYNAFTVKLILDHYPLKSIKDISDGLPMINSPWDIKFFKIGGVDFDLNTIEHEILRKQFNEPRIHFAINCASFSCPKLRNEAFFAEKLDVQLEQQARDFIHNADKNYITKTETKLSKIFDWFQSDFIKNTDLLSYIQHYHPEINKSNLVNYLEYNWNLNE